jgi:hypothetical protein
LNSIFLKIDSQIFVPNWTVQPSFKIIWN